MKKRTKVICYLAILWIIIGLICWQSQAFAIDVTIIGVSDGGLRATGRYFATGGTNPYYQTEYISSMSAKGMAGIAIQNSFSGAISTKEQLEVQKGFGRFETRVGADTLLNTTNADTGITTGVLKQPAIGFGGTLSSGIVATAFDTTIFKRSAEAEMVGTLKAGAMQVVTTGSNEPGTLPKTTEYYKGLWNFGPGQIQGKIEIIFPK
jgi:hypothetical protein